MKLTEQQCPHNRSLMFRRPAWLHRPTFNHPAGRGGTDEKLSVRQPGPGSAGRPRPHEGHEHEGHDEHADLIHHHDMSMDLHWPRDPARQCRNPWWATSFSS